MSNSYLVTWELEIDAETPHDAAVMALQYQRDPDSIATVFTVIDRETTRESEVDLSE